MVFPLPPIENAKWGSEVAHPPGIPLLSDMPESERRSEDAVGGPGSSASHYAGGGMPYGGGMEGGMPGYPGYAAPVGEQAEVVNRVLSFFQRS